MLAVACVFGQEQDGHFTLLDNVQAKLRFENLDADVVLGPPRKKSISIIHGAEFLLDFVASASKFKKDRIWSRLAHSHPFSTMAFREKNDPSTHVLFRKTPEGDLKAEMHLDGNGPQRLFPHLNEFLFHKLTFRDSNQDRMHANLTQSFERGGKAPDEVFISREERTKQYLHETLGLQPLAMGFTNSLFRHYVHRLVWKTEPSYEPMINRFEASLFRNALRNTIEFGIANWREEDTRFRKSGEEGLKRRMRAAVVNTFVVKTATGREFAYGRFAAIAGTTALTDVWHPWRAHPFEPNYARQATFGMVLDPLARSVWAEFGGEIKRRLPFSK